MKRKTRATKTAEDLKAKKARVSSRADSEAEDVPEELEIEVSRTSRFTVGEMNATRVDCLALEDLDDLEFLRTFNRLKTLSIHFQDTEKVYDLKPLLDLEELESIELLRVWMRWPGDGGSYRNLGELKGLPCLKRLLVNGVTLDVKALSMPLPRQRNPTYAHLTSCSDMGPATSVFFIETLSLSKKQKALLDQVSDYGLEGSRMGTVVIVRTRSTETHYLLLEANSSPGKTLNEEQANVFLCGCSKESELWLEFPQ